MELEKTFIHKNQVIASAYTQATVEDDYNLPDYKPDLMKLIDTKSLVAIEETKVGNQSVFVQGKLQFSVLYRGESPEREISSLTGELPFREKINLKGVEELDPVTVRADVAELGVSVINSRKLSFRAVLEFWAESGKTGDTAFPVGVSPEKNCEIRKTERQILQLVENRRDVVRIRQEISLPQEKPNAGELIWHICGLEGVGTHLAGDSLEITGTARVCVLYKGMNEAPFEWYETSVPVTGVISCQYGASADYFQVRLCNTHSAVELREDADQEMRRIGLDLDLDVDLSLWKEEQLEFLEDMYSLTKDLKLTRSSELMEQILIKNYGKTRVSGEMKLDDLEEAIYLCAGQSKVRILRTQIVEDGVEVQGELRVSVLCLTADDDIPLTCAKEVFPFTQILEAKGIDGNSRVELEADTDRLQLTLTDAHHADVRGEIQLNMMVFAREMVPVIQDAEEEEPDEKELHSRPGMVGYIVRPGESLWDIAKEYHTTLEELRQTNHLESDVLLPGQKLLVVKTMML